MEWSFSLNYSAWVFGLCLLLLSASVQALPSSEEQKKAQKLSEEAGALFFEDKFKEALSLYKEAYQLYQYPPFLYSIGLCHQKLGERAAAQFAFCGYLSSSDTARRNEAETHLKEIIPAGEALCPVIEEPVKETTSKWLLPGVLAGTGALAGTGVILLRLVAPGGPGALLAKNFEPGASITKLNHTAGITLALTADLSFIASGVTLFLTKKKQGTTLKEAP